MTPERSVAERVDLPWSVEVRLPAIVTDPYQPLVALLSNPEAPCTAPI